MKSDLVHRFIFILIMTPFMTHCSASKMALSHIETIAAYKVDDIFDLDNQQEEIVDQTLERKWRSIRKNHLGPLAQVLSHAADDIEAGMLDEKKYFGIKSKVDLIYTQIAEEFSPDISDFFATLEPSNLKSLREFQLETNEELEELLNLSKEEYQKKRHEKVLDSFEDWCGDIEDNQRDSYLALYKNDYETNKQFLAQKKHAQDNFYQDLKSSTDASQLRQKTIDWFVNRQGLRSKEMEQIFQNLTLKRDKRTIAIITLLNQDQRKHLADRIRHWAATLNHFVIEQNTIRQTH